MQSKIYNYVVFQLYIEERKGLWQDAIDCVSDVYCMAHYSQAGV